MKNPELKNLIKLIAKEEGLTMEDVKRIPNVGFEFQAHVMRNKCNREKLIFPSVRIPYWGIFFCREGTKERLARLNEKNKNGPDALTKTNKEV